MAALVAATRCDEIMLFLSNIREAMTCEAYATCAEVRARQDVDHELITSSWHDDRFDEAPC